ncbi:hypothetical protein QJQ45_014848 [Haematococcus lacustris]|nr:hypothetical protein QJQ45_014848 [Haematococcus lacustris]
MIGAGGAAGVAMAVVVVEAVAMVVAPVAVAGGEVAGAAAGGAAARQRSPSTSPTPCRPDSGPRSPSPPGQLTYPDGRTVRPRRPPSGQLGQHIHVLANHFAIGLTGCVLQRHDVQIRSAGRLGGAAGSSGPSGTLRTALTAAEAAGGMLSLTDLKAMKREEARPVIAQLVQQLRLDPWAFDGRALLLSLQRAPQGLHEVVLGAARYEVDLKWTGELDLTRAAKTLLDFTASQTPATAQQLQLALGQEALQALDVLVRSAIARRPDLVPRATSYYSASNDESAGNMEGGCMVGHTCRMLLRAVLLGSIRAARGFSATLDLNQRGLTLAVDSKVTPFIKEQLLTELIAEIIGVPHRQLQSSRQPINAMQFKKLRSTLKGLQVEMAEGIEQTRFKKLGASKGKPRGFTIKGVDKVTPDDYKFRCEDLNPDQDISIATYFKKKYGVDLQYPLLPCICVNERRKISMPAEVLRVKVQPLPRKPTASQTAALVTMAAVKPHIRRQVQGLNPSDSGQALANRNIMDAVKRQSGLLPQSQAGSSRGGGSRAVADADEPARVLAQFGVQIKLDSNSDMMRVPARVIPPPKMQYQPPGPGVPRADPDVVTVRENGSWTLEARRFFQPAPRLDSWAVLVIADEQKVASALQPFLTAQREALQAVVVTPSALACIPSVSPRWRERRPLGAGVDMAPGQVPVLYLSDYRAAPLRSMFQDAVKAGTQVFGCAPKLLLFVLETKRSDAYKDIKLLGDCELGVVTQCVTCEKGVTTRNKPSQQQQYCRNVALKINTKLKGVNHVIHEPDPTHHPQRWLPEPLRHKRVMAVGIDVNHDSATQPSMAAVVASMDPFMTSYAAQIITQPRPHEEFISPEDMQPPPTPPCFSLPIAGLQAAMEALLMMYVKRNKALPEVLLVWRDGVADSQIDRICGQEYVAIHKACDESGMDMDEGRIVFTSVQKRHNTRLFPERKPDEGSREQYGPGVMANVQTGTVVEGLGSPEFDDFILVSQHGGMGTSRGARYLPLVDELGLTADERQRLTYWMCFLYGRCTMPVSVPAPVYHADRAAMRGRVLLNALRGTDDSSDIGSVLSGDIGGGSGALGPEGEAAAMAGGPKVEIHDRLKDTTFFI